AYLPAQPLEQKRELAKRGGVALGRSPRILVIEDDDAVREALLLALEMEDFDPVAAATAEQALQVIQESNIRPDLVVSDYHLGAGMTGVEVVTQLRQVSGAALPAVFLSGDTSSAMRSVREFPRSELLRKPVDLRQLANAARELLANKADK
ncbi:MAG: response regulator, partial [Steroidobacteraceae bacterium]